MGDLNTVKKNKSIIENDNLESCFLCGSYGPIIDEHHIFGGSCRMTSDKHGLVVHLCRDCHSEVHANPDGPSMRYLHNIGQRTYEARIGTRERFREEFIRSYL